MKIFFIVFLLFLGSLFFREQKLPRVLVTRACDYIAPTNFLVKCTTVSFGFRHGLEFGPVQVYQSDKGSLLEPVVSFKRLRFFPIQRKVVISGLKYPRLPDSYYSTVPVPYIAPDCSMRLKKIPEFRLVLERSEVLGLTPSRVTAQVFIKPRSLNFDEVHVEWVDTDSVCAVDGCCRIDLDSRKLMADVRGRALQRHIRPLLEALDLGVAFPYFDGFTEVTVPVDARGEFKSDFDTGTFDMRLDLAPELGRYNGVRMSRAKGSITLHSWPRESGIFDSKLVVDLPYSVDPDGRKLTGQLGVLTTNGVSRVDLDLRSELKLADLFKIVDYFDADDFSRISMDAAPHITARGHFGTSAADIEWHDLSGGVFARRCDVYGMPLKDIGFDYTFQKDKLEINRIRAIGKRGGLITGALKLDFHEFDPTNATFEASARLSEGQLDELADVYGVDLAGRDGKLDLAIELSGPVGTNDWRRLNGKGSAKVSEGHLLQMKLFAGLTQLLSENVPGVEYIVNQSDASADFTVENGVFKSENIYLEGGLISLKGWGGYDLAEDNLDFTVRVQFMKKESLMGTILHPLTYPITKLLLEFQALGKLGNPDWKYISVIDRIF